ncbi:MAG: putative m7GpppX diphosphatase isoform X2 [Edafosvirus sp.]|uniref:Putative m7GpppX diphosphatase isoform X2 n=1 Tax=Edafosvirus sp. TaxID=2487765 RepID=A0A3G4ZV40_9VIRU|nr:MAG: putative m7GpppX diphosphatase isoform X2 [Edafosvirus sp.]
MNNLSSFQFNKILSRKYKLIIECTNNNEKAIVSIDKINLTDDSINSILSEETNLQLVQQNDIYSQYTANLPSKISFAKIDVIYPVTPKIINKYASIDLCNYYKFFETPTLYEAFTKPFMISKLDDLTWMYNIIDHVDKNESILSENDQFILLPDIVWNRVNMNLMHLLLIPKIKNIMSIRDLRGEHINLLENMRDFVRDQIKKIYNVDMNKLHMHFHYVPTYFHLHLHVTYIDIHEGFGRVHFLDDVIDNLKLDGNYYMKKTMAICLPTAHPLTQQFMVLEKN